MIAVKCSRCGHEREVTEAEHGREMLCARCGAVIDPSADSATVSARPLQTVAAADSAPDSRNEETIAGPASKPLQTFAFLAAAKTKDEIGWLKHYRVIRLLGQGGMGIVFEAVDTKLQRTVALKVMKPDIASDELARQRFEREARATAAVKSDFIVVIHDVDKTDNIPYLAMELLHGEPLDKWLTRRAAVNLQVGVRIGIEIARGLAAAHEKGLIHRDIKPGNIWLESEDRVQTGQAPVHRFRVKILDFGLARNTQETGNLTLTGHVLGTPAYMAPEQAEGTEVDARCDLFSLGCVLYELVTGQLPFAGVNTMAMLMAVAMKDPKPPLQLNPDLPPHLSELILRLLAKSPKDRPATARIVAESLEGIAAEMGLALQTPASGISRFQSGVVRPVGGGGSRRKLVIGAVGLAVLLLAGLGIWFGLGLFSKSEIVLGMSGPFSGPSKELGREMEIGIKIAIRNVNDSDKGGVNGHKLKLIALDDKYEPDDALANMKKLKDEYKVFAVVGNIGTPTAAKTVPYAAENKMLFYGAFTGAPLLRENPPNRYVFNYRASYEEETAAIVMYLVNKQGIRADQIAVFAQKDPFGDAGFRGVASALPGTKDILRVDYIRNPPDANEAVKEAVAAILNRKDIKAVVMVATYKPAAAFIKQLKDAKRDDIIFTNVSFVGSEALAEELGAGSRYIEGVIVTQVVPPVTSGSTAVETYRDLLKKYYPNERPSFTSLEGYLATTLFIEGLKRVSEPPTPEKLMAELEKLKDVDLGTGAVLSFSPSQHQASHTVWGTKLTKAGVFEVLELK